jgi:hypothetical protein
MELSQMPQDLSRQVICVAYAEVTVDIQQEQAVIAPFHR